MAFLTSSFRRGLEIGQEFSFSALTEASNAACKLRRRPGYFYGTAPALADLDGDCIPEIVLQTRLSDRLAWRRFTVPRLSIAVPGGMGNSSPVIGDVDGDGLS